MNILFVKHGSTYTSKQVNNLYNELKKHIPYANYYCYTEDPSNLSMPYINIKTKPVLKKWWNKLALFDLDLPGKNLFLDIDTVINSNPLQYLTWNGLTVVNCDWKNNIPINHNYDVTINSQVITWIGNEQKHIWNYFLSNKDYFMRKYKGIDRFIVHEEFNYNTFNTNMIQSCKYQPDKIAPITTYEELDYGTYFTKKS